LDECAQAGLPLAIVTTTSRPNIDILLGTQLGPDWASRFASIVSAQEAPLKKPNPQAYLMALAALRILPQEAVAIEDAPAGAEATAAAGIPLIITRSFYFPDTSAKQALATGPSLGSTEGWYPAAHSAARIDLEQIRHWHANRARAAAQTRSP
jgi:beta-phosphoglucomutase-like phosphatase (HAD superfamily)